jgi:hypothetical protein
MGATELLQDAFGTGLSTEERNIQRLVKLIEREGTESAFWSTFDAYAQVVGTDVWEDALSKLPINIQDLVNKYGLNSNLDWDFWGRHELFGLQFEDSKEVDEFYETNSSAYTDFLNAIEMAMWEHVKNDPEFAEWEKAKKLAYG